MSFKKWIANLVLDGFKEIEENSENEECDCDECRAEREKAQIGYPGPTQDEIDNWIPPARFLIHAGGVDYWVDDIRPNAIFGWDLIWTQKIKGEDRHITCVIYDTNIVLVDYESQVTPEIFAHVKKQSMDYVMAQIQDAKIKEEVESKKTTDKLPDDINLASYS